jgi:hypothetical protein
MHAVKWELLAWNYKPDYQLERADERRLICLLKYRLDVSIDVYSNTLQRYEEKLIASGQSKFDDGEELLGFVNESWVI